MIESAVNDELALLILPWAKATHVDAYERTVAVSMRPIAYRNYLVRLIEMRWDEEPEWRTSVPLRCLEATGISATFRAKLLGDGVTIQVAGERYEGGRQWSFGELQVLLQTGQDLNVLHAAKTALDLVIDVSEPPTLTDLQKVRDAERSTLTESGSITVVRSSTSTINPQTASKGSSVPQGTSVGMDPQLDQSKPVRRSRRTRDTSTSGLWDPDPSNG